MTVRCTCGTAITCLKCDCGKKMYTRCTSCGRQWSHTQPPPKKQSEISINTKASKKEKDILNNIENIRKSDMDENKKLELIAKLQNKLPNMKEDDKYE